MREAFRHEKWDNAVAARAANASSVTSYLGSRTISRHFSRSLLGGTEARLRRKLSDGWSTRMPISPVVPERFHAAAAAVAMSRDAKRHMACALHAHPLVCGTGQLCSMSSRPKARRSSTTCRSPERGSHRPLGGRSLDICGERMPQWGPHLLRTASARCGRLMSSIAIVAPDKPPTKRTATGWLPVARHPRIFRNGASR